MNFPKTHQPRIRFSNSEFKKNKKTKQKKKKYYPDLKKKFNSIDIGNIQVFCDPLTKQRSVNVCCKYKSKHNIEI